MENNKKKRQRKREKKGGRARLLSSASSSSSSSPPLCSLSSLSVRPSSSSQAADERIVVAATASRGAVAAAARRDVPPVRSVADSDVADGDARRRDRGSDLWLNKVFYFFSVLVSDFLSRFPSLSVPHREKKTCPYRLRVRPNGTDVDPSGLEAWGFIFSGERGGSW